MKMRGINSGASKDIEIAERADMWRATYPHICVGCGYVTAWSRSGVISRRRGLCRHILSDAFEQLQHCIFGLKPRRLVARNTRLV